MLPTTIKLAALGLAATIGLGGCTDGYGYSGVSVGYGNGGYGNGGYGGGYYDGYDDDYYGGGGYPASYYSGSYYGWYGDYYYPGTGAYVYGRDRRPLRWNDQQRRYWEGRGNQREGGGQVRDNWQAFNRDRARDNRGYTQDRRTDRQAYQSGQAPQGEFRTERQGDRQTYRPESRQGQRDNRRERRD